MEGLNKAVTEVMVWLESQPVIHVCFYSSESMSMLREIETGRTRGQWLRVTEKVYSIDSSLVHHPCFMT
uniref:Uncharacterized protein n=1 Tax=Arion vulgaris TaxID=1028688 RepID=A0A0B6Y718_9EUPU